MKISLNWIKAFVDLPKELSGKELGQRFTLHTAEVEEVEDQAGAYEKMVVGQIDLVEPHPNADKLRICKVNIGGKTPAQIVCGGKNLEPGMKVAIALPGAKVRWHGEGDLVELSETKIRGESSFGMICAGEEIGLETDNPPGFTEVRIKDLSYLKEKPGTPLAEALGKEGIVIDIDNKSLTHRPDLWSHYGIAREFAAIFKKPLKPLSELPQFKAKSKPTEKLSIDLHAPDLCPRFSGCIVKGVKIVESPQWMKSRLQAAGIRPINNVVDTTNYVMLEIGQPMHAYDRALVGDALEVRHAKTGETLETIDHKQRPLHPDDPVVANVKGPLGVAGIMGGANSEIQDATTEVVFEAANWNSKIIRRASTRHGLRTEASQRFEKSLDPSLTNVAIERALILLHETCPDMELVTPVTTVGDWKYKPLTLSFQPDNANRKIGVKISEKEMASILESLDFEVKSDKKPWKITVPSHRATGDVDIEEDLVEEVARMYGYNHIPEKIPELPIRLPLENTERLKKHRARRILAHQLGFTETLNYSFYSEEDLKKANLDEAHHLRVKNALSSEQTHMRVTLVPGLLLNLAKNSATRDTMKLFEVGHTYKEVGEFMPFEEKWIVGAVAERKPNHDIFYEAKGAAQTFLQRLESPQTLLRKCTTPPSYAHPQKCMEILIDGKVVGTVFALHPGVAKAFDIDRPVGLFELNLTQLVAAGSHTAHFQELPKFPSIPFDVSVLVDRKTEVETLEKAIWSANPHGWLRTVRLFDIYEGKNLPEGKKSLAFTLELRHDERTLTDQEFQETQTAVFAAIEKMGGQVRKG